MHRPELLAPAGDLERLRAAVDYGADAVYIAGKAFGMRTSPSNFTQDDMRAGIDYARTRGVKVYVACNILPRNEDLAALPSFVETCRELSVDALIVSDLGVLQSVRQQAPELEVHISTQAGIVNYAAAQAYYSLGATRVVLARELSLQEIADIRANTSEALELECFVHGAMCVSFSGRCLISSYLTGRDANRGDCAQPCRWQYSLVEEKRPGQYFPVVEDEEGTYFFNAKDLCMIEHIPALLAAGVNSLKIEGRAKSAYYTAVITHAYRCAIDAYLAAPAPDYRPAAWMVEETEKVSHREYGTGFFLGAQPDNQVYGYGGYVRGYTVAAVVEASDGTYITVTQRNRFFLQEELEVLEPHHPPYSLQVTEILTEEGEAVEAAPHPMQRLRLPCDRHIPKGAFLRKRVNSH